MPSRVSAARSDCGTGGGGGVSGQIAETHTSSRLLGVAQQGSLRFARLRVGFGISLASLRFARLRAVEMCRRHSGCLAVLFVFAALALLFAVVVFALQRLFRCLLLLYDCGLASPRN